MFWAMLLMVSHVAAEDECHKASFLQTDIFVRLERDLQTSPLQQQTKACNPPSGWQGICAALQAEDRYVPMEEVISRYAGLDGYCIFGELGNWTRKCAIARCYENARPFAESYSDWYKTYLLDPVSTPKKLRMPNGREITIRDHQYPLDDLYCLANGWYDLPRSPTVNNFTYLVQVSESSCRLLETTVPSYHNMTLNMLIKEGTRDEKRLEELLRSSDPVVDVDQSLVDGMKFHAAAKCVLAGGKGAVCDIANCAMRGCLSFDGAVGYAARGECPPV
ncbi:unnamed protein product [Symbiodinium sp. CCMP2592]|nr:unnamed protein product [Symbiodinium sp. CCMP2592]